MPPAPPTLTNRSDIVEVLLVEDNPSDVELTLHALNKHNVVNHVQAVRDGQEALDYIYGTGAYAGRHTGNTPKVIFLDLKLPKIDGLEVLRRLKADPLTRSIPIVVVTSSREERDLTKSYQLGVNSYVVKPVDFEQFSQAIRSLGFYWLVLNQSPNGAS
jgi:two-component system response regulator